MTATCLILGHRDNSGEKDDSAKSKKPPLTLCTFFTFCFVMTRLKGWPVWCWMVMPDYLTDFFFQSSSELLKYIFGAKHSRGSSVCEICPRLDKDKFWPHKRISVAAQLVSSGQSLGFYAMNMY